MLRLQSWVCETWFSGQGTPALLVDPATEAPLAECDSTGLDFAKVLHHARTIGGPALRALTFAQRAALLRSIAKALHGSREALLDLSQKNGGNTRSDAKFDVDGSIGTLSAYAEFGEALATTTGDRRFLLDGDMFPITRSPRFVGQHIWSTRPGVAVHINAFNFPAWGTFEKVAVALLAGEPIITKPATATAALTWKMVEILVEANLLPPGALQLVCGSTGDLLQQLGPQDHLAFTGSNSTGSRLRNTPGFAERGVRVNVEADSLNAAVCGPDVAVGSDLWNTLLRNVRTDITQKTGQKCTAVRRVFLPDSVIDTFQEALVESLSTVVVGNPLTDGVTMGPVSTSAQRRDVLHGIKTLALQGRIVCGGDAVEGQGSPPNKGYFVPPTVIRADQDHPTVHELEVFGPCVSLIGYDGSATSAASLVGRGQGSLVSSAYADDREWTAGLIAESAPWLGRLLLVSSKVADQATAPGLVMPSLVHGGPGRAGGGEELGGERGLKFYMQRTALQGDRAVFSRVLGTGEPTV